MVSLQQPSHFFGKLLIVAGLEDPNFTFYKIAVHVNSCLSDIEYDAFDIGEFGILSVFKGNNFRMSILLLTLSNAKPSTT